MPAERAGADLARRPVAALELRLGEVLGLSLRESASEGVAHRLRHRIQDRALDGVESYAEYLLYGAGRPAWEDLAETLTANESRMFGASADWTPLFEMAADPGRLPGQAGSGSFRCLSAGCGTGEEAYSLAITMAEAKSRLPALEYEVIGVDLSARAVASARRAVYPASRGASIPPELLQRYFTEHDGRIVAGALKPYVRFARANLCEQDSLLCLGSFDLILARGFLPSLTAEGGRTALTSLARALKPGGVLLLGPGDSIGDLELGIHPIRWGERYAYEKPSLAPAPAREVEPAEPPDPELALVAHRSAIVRSWIRILLGQRGLFVEEAPHGMRALERVAMGRPPSFYLLERSLPPHGGAWVRDRLARLGIARPEGVVFLTPEEPGLPLTGQSLDLMLPRSTP